MVEATAREALREMRLAVRGSSTDRASRSPSSRNRGFRSWSRLSTRCGPPGSPSPQEGGRDLRAHPAIDLAVRIRQEGIPAHRRVVASGSESLRTTFLRTGKGCRRRDAPPREVGAENGWRSCLDPEVRCTVVSFELSRLVRHCSS
jgi:hypothetical protein